MAESKSVDLIMICTVFALCLFSSPQYVCFAFESLHFQIQHKCKDSLTGAKINTLKTELCIMVENMTLLHCVWVSHRCSRAASVENIGQWRVGGDACFVQFSSIGWVFR